ncbi:hypothetical protein COSO111634_33040 [Corallococcus soli]
MGPTALWKPGPFRSCASNVATASKASSEAARTKTPTSALLAGLAAPPAFIFLFASALRLVAISCRESTAFSARPPFLAAVMDPGSLCPIPAA